MLQSKLKDILSQFIDSADIASFKKLNSGHINDTYLVTTKSDVNYILQRINHNVFKNVPGLVSNKVLVSKHLQGKFETLSKKELKRRVLTFVEASSGQYYFLDSTGNYWNMMHYISESKTIETVNEEEIAYEGGKLIGEFLNLTSDFEASQLIDVIPNFHDMSFRFSQFETALKDASIERINKAFPYVGLAWELKDEMHILQNLKESGEIKLRVTHNDTKISNILFDEANKGLCVIDTDTVMPGIIHYDFGDAIRTICNSAAEDETDLDRVNFNLEYYHAYLKGFLEEVGSSLSSIEKNHLPLGAKTMIFIMALRFLTDYLNNDIYYKINYPEHNLDRSKNQFKLIESLTKQLKF